jgi:NAD+ synthase
MFDAQTVTKRIVNWISEFFEKNGSPETKAVIGISGGKDSSVTAALCVRALGKSRVLGVLLPQGKQPDIDVARDLCVSLDIQSAEINIGSTVQSLFGGIGTAGLTLNNAAAVNTPARIRMAALYAIAAITGGMVANTSNLSEDWVGYSTKFGDAAGDFSPLSDLTAGEVKAVGSELGLDAAFTEKTPLDGLSGKTDEENLGFSYAVLDRYIRGGVCGDADIKDKIDRLYRSSRHKITNIPSFKL